ncbi:hypothetical protein [Escherichia coli]|uniref:hypothetical protein n=1 Tax=Escherichia coli TaxID=562 RepID=UPI000DA4E9E8|nr:hypothetical protein [Escherichia coli]EFC1861618.1 hypothetical protein [Escherichia coli]EJI3683955.1 hypothetical protein [Escherichia coli]SQQ42804.1 Uncharacterised protein [Escherichia coli]
MLINDDEDNLSFLMSLSSEVSCLGIRAQSYFVNNGVFTDVCSHIGIDVYKGCIWLRLEIYNDAEQQNLYVFENDILTLNIDSGLISINCSLYSSYGYENLINYSCEAVNFDFFMFREIEKILFFAIQEHVKNIF